MNSDSQEVDPVCGMRVEGPMARTAHVGGKIVRFCSDSCRQKFAEHPERYVEVFSAPPANAGIPERRA